MQCWTATNIGLIREENQDRVEAREYDGHILAIVCDGMGGERSGSQASEIAMRELYDRFNAGYKQGLDAEKLRVLLVSSVSAANSVIYTTARMDYKSHGMGTTCVAAYVEPGWLSIVNVGDSRAYLVQNGEMRQLTTDHTVVNMLMAQGKLASKEAKSHPQRNMLTRAVGVERVVKPDYYHIPIEEEFLLLLCSDGLSGCCTDKEIYELIRTTAVDELAQALVDLALEHGGRDNISLAIVTS
ncbi:MAG: Stp1/IreP family PP2C-type Ser/Thr phosphatase [Oscillospiraceae bacterium]|nr:Stp1/IreP family PP2C-type Ser/Thr phosphatase [Oscillospiraceae bacterium]